MEDILTEGERQGLKFNQQSKGGIPPVGPKTPPPTPTITAKSNDTTLGTVRVSGSVIIATPNSRVVYANPAYEVISGTATVRQNGEIFTVTASTDCTIQINFEAIIRKKWYQKWQNIAVVAALCLIIYFAFFAIKSLFPKKDPNKKDNTEIVTPSSQLLAGDYNVVKLDGTKLTGNRARIKKITENEYDISLLSDFSTKNYRFSLDEMNVISPELGNGQIQIDKELTIVFTDKNNQKWEFSKKYK